MESTTLKTARTRNGHTYAFYHHPPADAKPTILFLHGFPSTHLDWENQIKHFQAGGYGIVAPDLLGYGKTDAPTDVKNYKSLSMTDDIVDVLDSINVQKVIGVAHDWLVLFCSA